jgi:hypothetical protein
MLKDYLAEIIQAAIALNNYDNQQKEFFKQTKGLADPRAKEIYSKLENRLHSAIINYVDKLQYAGEE